MKNFEASRPQPPPPPRQEMCIVHVLCINPKKQHFAIFYFYAIPELSHEGRASRHLWTRYTWILQWVVFK